jgi:hypothetical protein
MIFWYATVHAKIRYGTPKNSGKATVLKFNKEEDGSDGENEQRLNSS